MDPATALAVMVTALANLALAAIEGQTPEQKAVIWQRHLDIQERLLKFFHIG
jgi:hypothetical protein